MSYAAAAAKGPKQSPEEVCDCQNAASAYTNQVIYTDCFIGVGSYFLLRGYQFPNSTMTFHQRFVELSSLNVSLHLAVGDSFLDNSYNIHLGRRYANPWWPCSRAPAPPQVLHDDSSTSSLVDVDSPHISSVPSDYSGETETQHLRQEHEREDAERQAEETEREAKEKFDEVSKKTGKEYEKAKHTSAEKGKEAKHKAKEIAHDVNEKAKEAGQKAKEVGHEAKVKAKEVGRDVNAKTNETSNDISENRDNPVVIGNAVIIGLGSIALGYG